MSDVLKKKDTRSDGRGIECKTKRGERCQKASHSVQDWSFWMGARRTRGCSALTKWPDRTQSTRFNVHVKHGAALCAFFFRNTLESSLLMTGEVHVQTKLSS